MKKFFRFIFITIIIGLVGAGGFYAWVKFSKTQKRDTLSIVPADAIFMVETQNLTKAWDILKGSKLWEHFAKNEYFMGMNDDIESIDSLIQQHSIIKDAISERKLLVSTHMTSALDFDFLFVVDLQKASKMSFLTHALPLIQGYTVNETSYKLTDIYELTDDETNEKIYLSIIDNLLVASFSKLIIEDAILHKGLQMWEKNTNFQHVAVNTRHQNLMNFYVNYNEMNRFLALYLEEDQDLVESLSNSLTYSAFDLNFENEQLTLSGYTLPDSVSSYISALSKVNPARSKAFEVMSDQTAFYMSIAFQSFNEFYQRLIHDFSNASQDYYKDYKKNIEKAEKYFDLDFNDVFFSWIGQEIVLTKLRPYESTRAEDVVVAIQAKDIDDAREGLEIISERIRKKSPVKYKVYEYKNYPINYLDRKNFFKLFFGKLFRSLEKPYYTFIDDYAVFSNSETVLKRIIDDYTTGNVLSKNDEAMEFIDQFDSKSNITIYIQTPKVYSNIYTYSKSEYRPAIKRNKALITSLEQIGYQLISHDNLYRSKLIAVHNENAGAKDELEIMEKEVQQDELIVSIENMEHKILLPDSVDFEDGENSFYYPDSTLFSEGNMKEGKLSGLWRTYYKSGNLKSAINYNDGQASGDAFFYYDLNNKPLMAEVVFNEDKLISEYKEYYVDGSKKSIIEFEDGERNGKATFYHKNAAVKAEGQYKDGEKRGKWKFYNESGDLINKEKWKKGQVM